MRVAIFYAKKHRIPLVASYHTHFDQYLTDYKMDWLEPLLWKYMHWFHADCQKIFVPSLSAKKVLEKRGFRRLEIWGRGVDTVEFNPGFRLYREETLRECGACPHKFTLLYVGRLAPEKNVELLIDVWELLPDDVRAGAQWVIVGDGPLYDVLVKRAEHKPIYCIGFKEGKQLSRLYAAADLFVFPSATETFGNVILEAMASGTAVIGAAKGGVKENVKDGRTGLLCPPDDARAFAEAIERLFRDQVLLNQIARSGLEHARRQSWNTVFSDLFHQYRSVLSTSSAQTFVSAG